MARPLGEAESLETFAGDGWSVLRCLVSGVWLDDHHADHSPRDGDTFCPVLFVLLILMDVGTGGLVVVQPHCAGWATVA